MVQSLLSPPVHEVDRGALDESWERYLALHAAEHAFEVALTAALRWERGYGSSHPATSKLMATLWLERAIALDPRTENPS